jgi:hypothetical protein
MAGGLLLLFTLAFFVRRWERFAEIVWIECLIMFTCGITHIVTTLPDSNGTQEPCWNSEYVKSGWWLITRWSAFFCGDMIW